MPRADTIHLSIAAYCDPLLAFTVRSAYSQAADPSRLRIGIVEQQWPEHQLRLDAEWARTGVRWLRLHALQARGPCWARALGMTLHQDEDWFFQVDSHTWFEPGWDERLLRWGRECAQRNPRHLITCYPNPFTLVDDQPCARPVTSRVLAHAVKDGQGLDGEHPVLLFEGVPVERDEPVAGFHVGAGCLFAPGRIVQELPYDPFLYFHGEEQALALRAWTHGWDIFHVPGMPVYHLYHEAGQATRPLHWDPAHDAQRARRSAELTAAAGRRLADLLWTDADLGVYGLGRVRSLDDYAEFSGIDYRARTLRAQAGRQRFLARCLTDSERR